MESYTKAPIQNPTTTPKDDFIRTRIDHLAEKPTDKATMTSIDTCKTTLCMIRRNTVLAALTKYIEVTNLTITKLNVIRKVCG